MSKIIKATDLFIEYQQEKLNGNHQRALEINNQLYMELYAIYRTTEDKKFKQLISSELEGLTNGAEYLAWIINVQQENKSKEEK